MTRMPHPIQIHLTTTPPCHTPLSPRPRRCPPDPSVRHLVSFTFISLIPLAVGQQNVPQYSYAPYATESDDHRSYYATSSQGPPMEHYTSSSSPASSYATPNHPGHLNQQASRHHPPHHHPQQFIPTPSQAYVYSGSAAPSARTRSSVEPYYHMSPNPQHVMHASPASTTHGASGRSSSAHGHNHPSAQTGSMALATGERYPCDLCDRSFTRLHDRRRHYETVHATSPVLHKCRYCRKDFSRADSLKRHVDNGCDEMPR